MVRPTRGCISVGTKPNRSRSATLSNANAATCFCSGVSDERNVFAALAMFAGERSAA